MVEASGLTLLQEQALAICPKISSSVSIPCSIFIIYEVIYDYRTRGTTPVQRALGAMSCIDVMASSAWFLSTWAVPAGSFAYAAGNQTTCNFQGFLLQLAIGAPLYNSSLALFYLLMIKRRWADDKLKRIERFVHAFILSFTIGTSILLLRLNQYNHIGAVCWVIGSPAECGNSSFQPSDVPCDRGDYAWAWGLALFYGPLWFCVICCLISMTILYIHVKTTHNKSRRYSSAIKGMRHSTNRSGGDERKVAIQAILYSLTFLITWMPSTLWSIAHWFNWKHYGLDIAAATAEPLQGMWNLLIFLKTRPQTTRKIRRVLAVIFPCVSSRDLVDLSTTEGTSTNHRVSFVTGLKRGLSMMSGLSAHGSGIFTVTDETGPSQENSGIHNEAEPRLFGREEPEIDPIADDIALDNMFQESDSSSSGSASSVDDGDSSLPNLTSMPIEAPAMLSVDDESESSHGSSNLFPAHAKEDTVSEGSSDTSHDDSGSHSSEEGDDSECHDSPPMYTLGEIAASIDENESHRSSLEDVEDTCSASSFEEPTSASFPGGEATTHLDESFYFI